MKIGIATFHWAHNYGAVIQAYALQTYLTKAGHEAQIINFTPEDSNKGLKQFISRSLINTIFKLEIIYRKRLFQDFRKKFLFTTPEKFNLSTELKQLSDRFEILISGSDQVWNPIWLNQKEGFWDFYFLSFAGKHTRRLSYAASFGHASISTFSDEWKTLINSYINKFNAITVREKSGISLVREISGREDAIQVADPTFLHDRILYGKLAGKPTKKKAFLFSYILHGMDDDKFSVDREISRKLGINLIKCDARKSSIHKYYKLLSPIQWLRNIRDAQFIVTNSFHAVVFCLIFNKPFIVILLEGEMSSMNNRIIELLESVELTSRIYNSKGFSEPFFEKEPDWSIVNGRLSQIQHEAQIVLNKMINE